LFPAIGDSRVIRVKAGAKIQAGNAAPFVNAQGADLADAGRIGDHDEQAIADLSGLRPWAFVTPGMMSSHSVFQTDRPTKRLSEVNCPGAGNVNADGDEIAPA
jgi:hypothetical protein